VQVLWFYLQEIFQVTVLCIYRDFAIRNCLVSADMTIKVGDYGLAEDLFKVRGCIYTHMHQFCSFQVNLV